MSNTHDFDFNDPVVTLILEARVRLLLEHPFFGQVAMSLKLVEASSWCRTAATDGRHFYYNRDFILNLKPSELMFLFGHEVWHCIYKHLSRVHDRDPDYWNMACDYVINYQLKRDRVGKMPPGALWDKNYTDALTAEEVYELLMQNSVEVEQTLDMHLDLRPDGQGGEGNQDDDGDSDSEPGDGSGAGQQKVKIRVMGGSEGPPKLTAQDLAEIEQDLRGTIIRAAQAAGDRCPEAIRRLIDDLIDSKLDWRAMLDANIRSALRNEVSYQRLARRTWGLRRYGKTYILPGKTHDQKLEIVVAVDSSGSITDEMLRDIVSEIKGIMETFRDYRIVIWSFDTQAHEESYAEFTPENLDDLLVWRRHKVKGGGGTTFEANWAFMRSREIVPDRFIMFTDGIPNKGWGDPLYCDTLFVIFPEKGKRRKITAPFGITAHYEP